MLFILSLYAVGFLLPLPLPGWRSLGGFAMFLAVAALWAAMSAQPSIERAPGGAGFFMTVALLCLALLWAGGVAGALTRGAQLTLRPRGISKAASCGVAALGFVLSLLLLAAWQFVRTVLRG